MEFSHSKVKDKDVYILTVSNPLPNMEGKIKAMSYGFTNASARLLFGTSLGYEVYEITGVDATKLIEKAFWLE